MFMKVKYWNNAWNMIKMCGQRYVHECVTGVVGPTGNIGRNEQSIICSDQKMINVTNYCRNQRNIFKRKTQIGLVIWISHWKLCLQWTSQLETKSLTMNFTTQDGFVVAIRNCLWPSLAKVVLTPRPWLNLETLVDMEFAHFLSEYWWSKDMQSTQKMELWPAIDRIRKLIWNCMSTIWHVQQTRHQRYRVDFGFRY